MSIRPKTKRRLVILLGAVGLLVVLAVSAFFARNWQLDRRAKVLRAEGLAAVQREDWRAGEEKLRHYLARPANADDPEALFQYARACRNVQMPEGKHLIAAIIKLRRLISLKPDHIEAHEMAVEMYTELGASTEAASAADRLLELRLDNVVGLRAKAIALTRLRRNNDALAATDHYLKIKPDDLAVNMLNMDLLQRLGKPSSDVMARAQELHKKNPNDARAQLLLACAYRATNDLKKAVEALRAAAKHEPPDAEYLQVLVGMLDNTGMFAESREVLEKSAKPNAPPLVLTSLAFRLWENGQDKELIERFPSLDLESELTPADLLGLKAMSLARTGKAAEAKPLADALRKRVNEMRSQAWSTFLDEIILANPGDARAIAQSSRKAIGFDARLGPAHAMAGQAYSDLGEREQSLREWQEASRLSPSWSLPFSRMSRLLAEMGRPELAVVAAREAGLRAPGNAEAAVMWITSRAANLGNSPADSPEKVLAMIDDVQKAIPGEPQTLALKVDMLLQAGRKDEAVQAIRAVINAKTPPPPETLIRLADVSRSANLGLEEACLEAYEKGTGPTPESVFFRADALAQKGQIPQGRKLIEEAVASEKDASKQLRWKLALAEYLDRTGTPDASTFIGTIADAEPKNLSVQQSVMRSRTAQNDRALMNRTIDRVKDLTGSDAAGWRVARARWLLQGERSPANATQALTLLQEAVHAAPEMLEARLLLARTLELQGNRSAALEELKAARGLAPRSHSIALDLATVLQSQGEADAAGALIEPVLKSASASPDDLRRAATLLAKRGQTDRAIEVLKKLDGGEGRGTPDLLLAVLYRSRNQLDAAEGVARQLLAKNPDAQTIEFAADLLGSRGKEQEAQQVLAMLEKLPGGPEIRELALGRYAAGRGRDAEAFEHFRKASELAPNNTQAWRPYLAVLARQGKSAELIAAADKAARALPGDEVLAAMLAQAKLAGRLGAQTPELFRPLVAATVEQPDRQSQASDALRVVVEGIEQSLLGDQVLTRLAPINERSGGFLALQALMARMHIALYHWDEAANLAARAMQASPGSAEAASLATQAHRGAGHWAEALAAAQKWRAITSDQPRAADLVLADLHLRTGQAEQALRVIEPYVKEARENPETDPIPLALHIQGLIARGKFNDAVGELTPLLPKSAKARAIWMEMAVASRDAATGTRLLEQAGAAVPQDKIDERLALAQAWMRLGERLNNPKLNQTGRGQLEQIAQAPDATASAVVTLGLLTDAAGENAKAEGLYRRALKLDPKLAVVRNNLAMLLLRGQGGKSAAALDEAVQLAEEAVKADARNADFRDTLATVQLQRKEYDKAIASQREAVRLAPENALFRLSLAQILVTAGKTKEASTAIGEIDALANRGVILPEANRAQLDELRRAVNDKPGGVGAAAGAK